MTNIDNYFNSLKEEEKEKMISIAYNNKEDIEKLLTKDMDIEDDIEFIIIIRHINRQKERIKKI